MKIIELACVALLLVSGMFIVIKANDEIFPKSKPVAAEDDTLPFNGESFQDKYLTEYASR